MEEEHHHHAGGGEIVVRITPRNLERLIYILIIIGLIIFSVVSLNKGDCPVIECEVEPEETTETNTITGAVVTQVTQPETTETNTTTPKLSGEVDFFFTEATTCIINETQDKARLDSVTISIKNGLSKILRTEMKIYVWHGSTTSFSEINHYATKIDNVNLISGNAIARSFTMDSGKFASKGMFTDIDREKKVKIILWDTDRDEIIEEKMVTGVEATQLCAN